MNEGRSGNSHGNRPVLLVREVPACPSSLRPAVVPRPRPAAFRAGSGEGCRCLEVIGVIDTRGDCAAWTFPADPGVVRTARTVVRRQLAAWGLDALEDVTALLVSELVTNSLRYAHGPIGVRLTHPEEVGSPLLVEVSDPVPEAPRERRAGPDEETGRGLQLVACTSCRWGTRRGRRGKTVWFELALPG